MLRVAITSGKRAARELRANKPFSGHFTTFQATLGHKRAISGLF